MKRRDLLKQVGLAAGAISLGSLSASAAGESTDISRQRLLRIAHITDVHIRPEHDAPTRFKKCLEEIKGYKPDFFLNGGDSIYAADYDTVNKDRVELQWKIWDDCLANIKNYEIHGCLGNHDMWWAAPTKQDAMYGKDYVVKRLGISNRYYSFDKASWHFIILDSNNGDGGLLDEEQRKWLETDLNGLQENTPVLILSHYPLLAACTHLDGGGMHHDYKYLVDLFYRHRDKIKTCISGHIHLQDRVVYNDVQYFCNGALSGFWWEDGDKNSAAKYYYLQTPPGYAIIDLYKDGSVVNTYHPHSY